MRVQVVHPRAVRHEGRYRVVKVDIDRSAALAARYEVDSYPTLRVFASGEACGRTSGPRAGLP